ncbi:MAG: TetR/AcrR family transcriptional regulator [Kineosporiaceae bacterium]|nr:TetR/AcrR family transcriptional regulator [Aeromicrobium sp.]
METKGWAVRETVDRADTERRRQLLVAARTVFERKGFGTATISEITREADVSRATFYVYFASKTQVFAVLAEQVRVDYLRAQELGDIDDDAVLEVLRATIGATLDVTVNNLALMTVLDHQAIADKDINQLWRGIRRQTVLRTARYLERCADRGLASLDASAETVAMMGAGMNDRFAPHVAEGVVERDYAVEQMLKVFLQVIGRTAD